MLVDENLAVFGAVILYIIIGCCSFVITSFVTCQFISAIWVPRKTWTFYFFGLLRILLFVLLGILLFALLAVALLYVAIEGPT